MIGLRQGTEYRAPVHVAFSTDRAGVDACYEAAIAAGGTDNGAPGIRPSSKRSVISGASRLGG